MSPSDSRAHGESGGRTATVEDRTRARFVQETADHAMRVIRDDGLYRHLRFRQPNTSIYHFDLVSWPGVLTITGDCGTFVFSRGKDMFEFFEPAGGAIKPAYWSEKLLAPAPQAVRIYSQDVYTMRVRQWLEDMLEADGTDEGSLRDAVREQLLDEPPRSESEAIQRLSAFTHDEIRIDTPYEWDLDEWDERFLWCCHAIMQGVSRYRGYQSARGEGVVRHER